MLLQVRSESEPFPGFVFSPSHLLFLLGGPFSGICELLLLLRTHVQVFIGLFLLVDGRLLPLAGLVVRRLGLVQLFDTNSLLVAWLTGSEEGTLWGTDSFSDDGE